VRGCVCVAAIAAAARGCALLATGIGREEAGPGREPGRAEYLEWGDRRDLGFSDRRMVVVPGADLSAGPSERDPPPSHPFDPASSHRIT